jgi:hypothetical protein
MSCCEWSLRIRWRPLLSAVIVTQLVTRLLGTSLLGITELKTLGGGEHAELLGDDFLGLLGFHARRRLLDCLNGAERIDTLQEEGRTQVREDPPGVQVSLESPFYFQLELAEVH